jgi:hypothetical protein
MNKKRLEDPVKTASLPDQDGVDLIESEGMAEDLKRYLELLWSE